MPCSRIYSKVVSVKFRLTPVGATKQSFYKSKLFTTSMLCSDNYQKFKTYADDLYREFIQQSISTLVLDDAEIDRCMSDRRAGLFGSSNALIKKISEHLRSQDKLQTIQDCKELVGVIQSLGYDTDFSCFKQDSTLVQKYIDSKQVLFGTDKDVSIAGRLVCDIFPTFYYNRGLQESFGGKQFNGSYSCLLLQSNIDKYNEYAQEHNKILLESRQDRKRLAKIDSISGLATSKNELYSGKLTQQSIMELVRSVDNAFDWSRIKDVNATAIPYVTDIYDAYETATTSLGSNIFEYEKYPKDSRNEKRQQLLEFLKIVKKSYKDLKDCCYYVPDEILSAFKLASDVLSILNKFSEKNFIKNEEIGIKFINGWDVNKEQANHACILKKDDDFYLLLSSSASFFTNLPQCAPYEDSYDKMCFKAIPSVRKYFSAKTWNDEKSDEMFQLAKSSSISPEEKNKLINYVKDVFVQNFIAKNDRDGLTPQDYFNYSFKSASEYASYDEFLDDWQKQSYTIWDKPVPVSYVEEQVEYGKAFLFKIDSLDMTDEHKQNQSLDNLHTMYFKSIFSDRNKGGFQYRLLGNARVSFRKGSNEQPIVHPAEEEISRKQGSGYSKFRHDIVKDKRFFEDQFFATFSIRLNGDLISSISQSEFNSIVKDWVDTNDGTLVIKRSQQNLIDAYIINKDGSVRDSSPMNEFQYTDYRMVSKKQNALTYISKEICNIAVHAHLLLKFEDSSGKFLLTDHMYDTLKDLVVNKLSFFIDKRYVKYAYQTRLNGPMCAGQYALYNGAPKQNGIII